MIYQYALAPNYGKIGWQYLSDAWASGCDDGDEELAKVCAGNAGVYRASGAAFLFFVIFGLGECILSSKLFGMWLFDAVAYHVICYVCTAAKCKPTANREAWPAK